MDTLVLDYRVCVEGRVQLTPFLRPTGGHETRWETYPAVCQFESLSERSKSVQRLLVGALQVVFTEQGDLDLDAAQGHLEELRKEGANLREILLPDDVVRRLRSTVSIEHLVFRCDPQLNGVPFELMFLGDFLGFRYAVGRELLTQHCGVDAQGADQRDQNTTAYTGSTVVDPNRLLLQKQAQALRAEFEEFRSRWDTALSPGESSDPSLQRLRHRINFDAASLFRNVRKDDIAQALRYHQFVNFICHHYYDEANPEESGFILETLPNGDPKVVFSAEDLQRCLRVGETPPYLLFSVVCRSGVTAGWETEWSRDARVFGMVDAAIRCGIRHYVSTTVKIPVERSPSIMLPFYQQIAVGQTVGQALREARRSFRRNVDDPLDGGTILGLAFILYGDPGDAYFCTAGHRTDQLRTVACQAVDADGSPCYRVVCEQDPGFGKFRCDLHTGKKLLCSAGHEVAAASDLAYCKSEGCRNTICAACRGHGQGLCWEHCCFTGHAIVGQMRKDCPDPFSLHPHEKRAVCPRDDGWMRGLDDQCLKAAQDVANFNPSCPHCGHFITDANPLTDFCADCGKSLCASCKPWYEKTLYCPLTIRSKVDKDQSWLQRLDCRGQKDVGLATPSRLCASLALGDVFQSGLATNVHGQTRRFGPMPKLLLSCWNVIGPHPRLAGIRLSVADLGKELATALRQWSLLPDRADLTQPWQPPGTWLDVYTQSNQLYLHELRSPLGTVVIVAVATVTPVGFEEGRGPVLIPCNAGHLRQLEQIVSRHLKKHYPRTSPDAYLVVHSVNGWTDEVQPTDRPGVLAILAQPQGDKWSLRTPAMDGRPEYVKRFVEILTPETVYKRKCRLSELIRRTLATQDFITAFKVQDVIEADTDSSYSDNDILDAFRHLEDSGRYSQFTLQDGQKAIRTATRAERSGRLMRRWRRELTALAIGTLAGLSAIVLFVLKNWQSMAIGTILMIVACQLVNQVLNKLTAFLKQK